MAEAIVNTASAAASADQDSLASKADLASLETRLTNTLATKADFRTLQWVVGIQSAIILATFAIVAARLL